MAGLDDVMARIANDPSFADAVRSDPTNALRGYGLTPAEIGRLEQALGTAATPPAPLFARGAGAGAGAAAGAGAGAGKLALVATSLAVLGGGIGFGLGAGGALGGGGGGSATLRPDAAPFFDCSTDGAAGAVLGDLHRGDTVWVIGRTGEQWLVIRNPQDLTTPAWMQGGNLEYSADVSGLPTLTCDQATEEAATPPDSTLPGETTTTSSTVPGETTTTAAATTTTAAATTTTSPAPTTTAADVTGPSVGVATNSTFVYSEGGVACAGYLQTLTVSVTASDPSGATVQNVTWSAGSLGGTATPLGGNQFAIGPVYSNHSGTITMTITAQAADGRGNPGSGQTTVQFRQIADECIG